MCSLAPMDQRINKRKALDAGNQGLAKKSKQVGDFEKYDLLPPEIRANIIGNLNPQDLFNYGKASQYCAAEAVHFKKNAPRMVEFSSEENGFRVKLVYSSEDLYDEQLFLHYENVMDDVVEFMKQRHRYVKYGKTQVVQIDSVVWPTEMMDQYKDCEVLNVVMYKTVLNDFIDHSQNASHKTLRLTDCIDVDQQVTVPQQFFETKLFKELSLPLLNIRCEINPAAFIDTTFDVMNITASIETEAILEKIWRLDDDAWEQEDVHRCLIITIPDGVDKVFELEDFVNIEESEKYNQFAIGAVNCSIEENGKQMVIITN